MTHDLEVLRAWIRIVTVITALAVTSFPILYSFTPWRTRPVGRILMLQGISFAVAIDLSTIFSFWRPSNILVLFWANAFILTIIAISTSSLTWWVWKSNRPWRNRR